MCKTLVSLTHLCEVFFMLKKMARNIRNYGDVTGTVYYEKLFVVVFSTYFSVSDVYFIYQ